MATTTTVSGLPVPEGEDPNDVPGDLGAVAEAIDKGWIRHLTQAQIDALTSAQKPAGVLVWNTTTQRLMRANGTDFVDAHVGGWQNWTPTLKQQIDVTHTVTWARYEVTGKTCNVSARVVATVAGRVAYPIRFLMPVAPAYSEVVCGQYMFTSPSNMFLRTGPLRFEASGAYANLWTPMGIVGYDTDNVVAVGDSIDVTATYEVA